MYWLWYMIYDTKPLIRLVVHASRFSSDVRLNHPLRTINPEIFTDSSAVNKIQYIQDIFNFRRHEDFDGKHSNKLML